MPNLEFVAQRSAIRKIASAILALLFRRRRNSFEHALPSPGPPADRPQQRPRSDVIRQRLAQAAASLERLDAERGRRAEPAYGKAEEERIVWSELLELELQELEEQVNRNGARDRSSRTPRGPNIRFGEGGSYEHNGP